MSSDVALLEQYLRSAETQGKSLRENAGLNEAAQQVGAGTGLFGYSNQGETMRATFEAMKKIRTRQPTRTLWRSWPARLASA